MLPYVPGALPRYALFCQTEPLCDAPDNKECEKEIPVFPSLLLYQHVMVRLPRVWGDSEQERHHPLPALKIIIPA